MSTKTERNRKYVAHDEKSKFSVFRPEIPYGSSRNVVAFFVEKLFLNLQKIKKPLPHYVSLQTPRMTANHTFSRTSLCLIRVMEKSCFELRNLLLKSLQVI